MHCGGCVKSVTGAVSRLAGVRKVDVSLEGKAATVEYDGEAVAPAAIVAAIVGAGFEARPR
jgi:copper chaperone